MGRNSDLTQPRNELDEVREPCSAGESLEIVTMDFYKGKAKEKKGLKIVAGNSEKVVSKELNLGASIPAYDDSKIPPEREAR